MNLKSLKPALSGLLATVLLLGSATNVLSASNDISADVRKEVERLLNDERFMTPIIERGINNFIMKQQAAAEAEKQQAKAAQMKNLRPVSAEVDHIYGNPDAPVTLVEYSDFECPYCKRFHFSAKDFVDNSKGQVNWVYRHYPLSFHNPGAQKEAEASECAAQQGGNDSFWKYTNLIYLRTKAGGKGFPIAKLVPLAVEIGLDRASFDKCLNSGSMAKRVSDDFKNGSASGITGTPGNILINNKTKEALFLNGAVSLQKLQAALKQISQ
ncbi:MAG: DsbA family protein [Gammaproteobacteria bacterium]|nr:DsbA family protein [Gammaproteobacteria bacterium]